MNAKASIFYDQRGTHDADSFYQFQVMLDDTVSDPDRNRSWIVVPRTSKATEGVPKETVDEYCWIESRPDANDRVEDRACKADGAHVTHSYYTIVRMDVYGGKRQSEFIPDSNDLIVLSAPFAERMRSLPLQGISLKPTSIDENLSGIRDPKFVHLPFMGRNCLRLRKIHGADNACPWCGVGLIICRECGEYWPVCRNCKRQSVVRVELRDGPLDKRLTADFSKDDKEGLILEGKRWDGADLIQCWGWNFISKRVLDWLLMVHAAPFYVKPARFCVDGMSEKQLARLAEIQKPLE